MLKQQSYVLSIIAHVLDFITICSAFVLAYYLRNWQINNEMAPLHHYLWLLVVVVPTWYFLLARFGVYASLRIRPFWSLMAVLIKVHTIGAVIVAASIYLVTPYDFSRWFFLFIMASSFVLMVLIKGGLKLFLYFVRSRGRNIRHLVLVGSGPKAQQFRQLVEEHACWGLRISTMFDCHADSVSQDVRCDNQGLVAFCRNNPVDEVIFCHPDQHCRPDDHLLYALETIGVTTRIVLDLYESHHFDSQLSFFHDQLPMVTYCSKAFSADQLFLKRSLDIVGSLVGLGITALMLPFVALAIKLEDPGPLFFSQTRVGENRRTFKCWKFRSMFVNAEARKQELMARNEMKGAMFKIKDDPRVTRVGRFIRKTSIDELPQFWNVLQGDMSLVGTRPPTPAEVATYENWHLRRVSIKPGITGLWQVSGRNQIQDFDDVVRLDLQYIDTWTIWQDVKILLKTIWVVFAGRGAQ